MVNKNSTYILYFITSTLILLFSLVFPSPTMAGEKIDKPDGISLGKMVFLPVVSRNSCDLCYFVDSKKGSDENSGTLIDTPWKTLDKVNQTTFLPGSTIYF